jgi:acyl carrier protein
MTNESSPKVKCPFVFEDGRRCDAEAMRPYDFCEHHLWLLTRGNVKKRVVDIVVDELNCGRDEVVEGARFVEDLGADSLDKVELVMGMEDAFDFFIPDKKADELLSVGQLIEHVTDVLLAKHTPMPYADKAVAEAADARARRSQQSERSRNHIVRSDLFLRYYELLGLAPERVEWLYRRTVRDERIYQVTPIPDSSGGRLNGVDVLLLGRNRIYHFDLRHDFLGFEWASLDDLTLTYEISLGEGGGATKVVVRSSSRDSLGGRRAAVRRGRGREASKGWQSLRDATFEFEGDEVEGAMEFLSRFLINARGER